MAESSTLYGGASRIAQYVLEKKFDVSLEGEDNIPSDGRCIVAPNHVRITDPYILLGWIRRRQLAFLNRYDHKPSVPLELFEQIRMLGTHAIGGVMIDRTSDSAQICRFSQLLPQPPSTDKAFRQMKQKLREGKALCMFPQGERSEGLQLKEIKAGIAHLALDDEMGVSPIIPVGINYSKNLSSSKQEVHIKIGEVITPEGSASSAGDRMNLLNVLGQSMLNLCE